MEALKLAEVEAAQATEQLQQQLAAVQSQLREAEAAAQKQQLEQGATQLSDQERQAAEQGVAQLEGKVVRWLGAGPIVEGYCNLYTLPSSPSSLPPPP